MLILNYSWAVWLAWLLAGVLVVSGVVNLAGIKAVREGFAGWGLPRWFHLFCGGYEVLAGAMVAWYPTRPFGLLLTLLLCVAIWVVLLRHRDYGHLPPSLILFAVTLLTGWGLRLIPL